jgi:hypothetical protein
MKKLQINRLDFELAFDWQSDESSAWLDTETGAVLYLEEAASERLEELWADEEELEDILSTLEAHTELTASERERLLSAAQIEGDAQRRYRSFPQPDSREGYRDMQDFIDGLNDSHLQELLETAIQGSGAFRRFKDVLYRYPEVQSDWFKFRDERERQRQLDWLAEEGIEPEFV